MISQVKSRGNPNISEIIINMNRLEHPTKLQRLSITHVCACAHPHTQCYYFRVSLWDWHSTYHANEAPHRVPFKTTQHRKDKKNRMENQYVLTKQRWGIHTLVSD